MSGAPSNYIWWLAGRSAGFVALALITLSVVLGLAMAARVIPPRRRGAAMRLHQHVALIGLAAIFAHGAFLAADPWLKAGPAGVLVPFAVAYRPVWTSMGIVAAYLSAALGLSFYLRRRIGARTWRRMHRLTVVAYALSLGHAIGAGTDAVLAPVRYAMLASAVPVIVLFALRTLRSPGPRRRAAATGPAGEKTARREDARGAQPGKDAGAGRPSRPRSARGHAGPAHALDTQPSHAS